MENDNPPIVEDDGVKTINVNLTPTFHPGAVSYFVLSLLLIILPIVVKAQEEKSRWVEKIESFQLQPFFGLQLWSTYSFGTEIYDEEKQFYQKVDNRLNSQIRRTRFGIKGEPYPHLKFNFTASLDVVGRDLLAGTDAGVNNGGSPKFRIWNAYVQWKALKNSEAVNIIAGYQLPQIGRASMTAALRSTSLEKSWSQNYLRRHLTGIGPGRALGINLGGLLSSPSPDLNFGYNFGVFNPVFESFSGNSTGIKYAPLLVSRLVMHIGDPEMKSYSISHKINYFSKRKGLSIALAGAHQNATDLFASNQALGWDFLFNWKHFNFDGEWTIIRRKALPDPTLNGEAPDQIVTANTGYIRMSYNIFLKNKWMVEPVIMMVQFNGPLDSEDQLIASSMKSNSGKDHSMNVGGNLYFNPNLKLSLHYTFRSGDEGEAGPGATVNNYFFQPGVGAIKRGEWLGLGLVMII